MEVRASRARTHRSAEDRTRTCKGLATPAAFEAVCFPFASSAFVDCQYTNVGFSVLERCTKDSNLERLSPQGFSKPPPSLSVVQQLGRSLLRFFCSATLALNPRLERGTDFRPHTLSRGAASLSLVQLVAFDALMSVPFSVELLTVEHSRRCRIRTCVVSVCPLLRRVGSAASHNLPCRLLESNQHSH